MPIHHFTPLLHSTTISNTSPLKVRVEYSCGSVEYTTTCSTTSTIELFFVMILTTPYAYTSMFYV